VSVDSYHEWIRLVAAFTVHSLESWQWAAASVYYLLGLWSRLVSSLPYLKGEAPSLLETYVPKITQAYLTSRRGPWAPCQNLTLNPPPRIPASLLETYVPKITQAYLTSRRGPRSPSAPLAARRGRVARPWVAGSERSARSARETSASISRPCM
jgi:hypothetical protein